MARPSKLLGYWFQRVSTEEGKRWGHLRNSIKVRDFFLGTGAVFL